MVYHRISIIVPCAKQWASLVAQLVKNPPAMQETRVRSQGQEDPLAKDMATRAIPYSCLRNPTAHSLQEMNPH